MTNFWQMEQGVEFLMEIFWVSWCQVDSTLDWLLKVVK